MKILLTVLAFVCVVIHVATDNVEKFNADLIVVTDGTYYKMANDWHASLSTLAKVGGYYYYVLPELKIEK